MKQTLVGAAKYLAVFVATLVAVAIVAADKPVALPVLLIVAVLGLKAYADRQFAHLG